MRYHLLDLPRLERFRKGTLEPLSLDTNHGFDQFLLSATGRAMEHVSEACHSRIEVIVCATFPLGLVQFDSMKREFAARKGTVRWLAGSGEGQS